MNLDLCLRGKRGCKLYQPKAVPMELVGEILEAGTCAPSAGNLQNWIFIVVTKAAKKEAIAVACLNQDWMKQAPLHIVVCNDVVKITDMYPTRGKLYATQACAIAAQNIMLKATDLGLHTCWVGAFNEEGVRRALQIPDHIVPEMVITTGYCNDHHEAMQRDACDKVTHFNEYGTLISEKAVFSQKPILAAQPSTGGKAQQGFMKSLKGLFKKK